MTGVADELILYEVFRGLRERRVPLGVPDYLDGLRALKLGFGTSGREELRQLCSSLWARSDDERRLVDALIDRIPRATAEELEELNRQLPKTGTKMPQAPHHASPSDRPDGVALPRKEEGPEGVEGTEGPRVGISFASSREPGGIPLPHLVPPPGVRQETFALDPQTIVSLRSLAVLWRRFRALRRSGPKTLFDLEATVEQKCRQGIVATPVFQPARLNTTRLLVLADAGPGMELWFPFLDTMFRSLALSRLQNSSIYYFSGVPRRSLFRTQALTNSVPLDQVLHRHQGAGLLVVSEAGSAQGILDPRRVARTGEFLRKAGRLLRPIVWINPMPRPRWRQTSAGVLERSEGAVFLPLDQPSLIKAIDVLRGMRVS